MSKEVDESLLLQLRSFRAQGISLDAIASTLSADEDIEGNFDINKIRELLDTAYTRESERLGLEKKDIQLLDGYDSTIESLTILLTDSDVKKSVTQRMEIIKTRQELMEKKDRILFKASKMKERVGREGRVNIPEWFLLSAQRKAKDERTRRKAVERFRRHVDALKFLKSKGYQDKNDFPLTFGKGEKEKLAREMITEVQGLLWRDAQDIIWGLKEQGFGDSLSPDVDTILKVLEDEGHLAEIEPTLIKERERQVRL